MEEPLGSRIFGRATLTPLVVLVWILFASSLHAHNPVQTSCAGDLIALIPQTIDSVAQSRPENTVKARKILLELQLEIRERVLERCPNNCTAEELAETVHQVTHEMLDGELKKPRWWRGSAILAAALTLNIGVNVFVQLHTGPFLAATLSTFLTLIGALTIDHLGASSLEIPLSYIRRWGFQNATDENVGSRRGSSQQRQQRVYVATQKMVTYPEEEARSTERQALLQLASVGIGPNAQERQDQFMERAANVFAKTLADLVQNYPDLDLEQNEYSEWAKVLFSQWHLNDGNREAFKERVLLLVCARFDRRVERGSELWRRYETTLKAWTKPLPGVTESPSNHL